MLTISIRILHTCIFNYFSNCKFHKNFFDHKLAHNKSITICDIRRYIMSSFCYKKKKISVPTFAVVKICNCESIKITKGWWRWVQKVKKDFYKEHVIFDHCCRTCEMIERYTTPPLQLSWFLCFLGSQTDVISLSIPYSHDFHHPMQHVKFKSNA